MCSKTVIKYPFTGGEQSLVRFVFAIIIAKYIFCLTSDIMLQKHLDSVRFKVGAIHSLVALLCYSVFLAYEQNILLGLVGAMMEVNNTTVEILRNLKEIGYDQKTYRNISILNCVLTLTFRGVIPIVFMVIAMFHERPFKMDYGPLTAFFLSIIFFSVISVWLVLSSVRRSIKLVLLQRDGVCFENTGDMQLSNFQKNNLGYLPRFDNINVSNMSQDHKMNYNNRKDFAKVGINTACAQLDRVGACRTPKRNTVVAINIETEHSSNSELSSSNSNLGLSGSGSERSIGAGFVANNYRSSGDSRSSGRSDSSGVVLLDNHSINSDNSQHSTLRTLMGNGCSNTWPGLTGRQNNINLRSAGVSASDPSLTDVCENM